MSTNNGDISVEILIALKTLRKRADRWWIFGVPKKHFGICFNLQNLLDGLSGIDVVQQFSRGWPEHSGSTTYPIPGGAAAYYTTDNKWAGEQGKARKRLLDYMIAKLEQQISLQLAAQQVGKQSQRPTSFNEVSNANVG